MFDKTVSEGSCNLCTEIVGIWFSCIDVVTEIAYELLKLSGSVGMESLWCWRLPRSGNRHQVTAR